MSVSPERRQQRAKEFLLYASGAAILLIALAAVLAVIRPGAPSDDGDADLPPTEATATVPEPVTSTSEPPEVFPEDRVAFVTAGGDVLTAIGAEKPEPVASDAAVDRTGRGSLSISPTGDLIVYVRSDGALVSVPVEGGATKVLADDVWLPAVGSPAVIAWDPTAGRIAYLAVGTEDMVEPRSDEPRLPSVEGAHTKPLPEGQLGAVIKIVDRDGAVQGRIGDPSTRSVTGITYSSTDDLMLVESEIPGEGKPYSLATSSSATDEIVGTPLSADTPSFSPDGNFIIAVGPRPGGMQELLRLSTAYLSKAVLTSDERICHPVVSPDSTRIVYGAGENCSRLMLISSRGGRPVDITPGSRPNQTFAVGPTAWTQDGHFLAFPDCRRSESRTTCSGNVVFIDPDRSVMINGPAATTVVTVSRPLLVDMNVHVAMSGPITYEGSFLVDAATQGDLEDISRTGSLIDVELRSDDRLLAIRTELDTRRKFVSGTMQIVDPAKGINRTFVVTGSASLLGLRVASVAGIWISTADMPFSSGEFRLSVMRST